MGLDPDETVEALSRLFATTLRTELVGPGQSFFDLGGHSLLAMELLLELERAFGVEVTVSSLYDHPTPAALARLLSTLGAQGEQNRFLIPIQPQGTKPPIFAIHVLGVNCEYYRPLAARLRRTPGLGVRGAEEREMSRAGEKTEKRPWNPPRGDIGWRDGALRPPAPGQPEPL